VTRVCLVGSEGVDLRYELLSRETARRALATYEPDRPFENTVAVETVSLGAAVALCNDLDWYLARFADAAWVHEPSISPDEWLSRELATAVRDASVEPDATGRYLTVYGVDDGALVEPMYVVRTGDGGGDGDGDDDRPVYDLRTVERTVTVRVTESEFA
jgi:hypothetical protein